MEKELPKGWIEIEFKEIVSLVIGGDWGKDVDFDFEVESSLVSCIRGSEIKNWNSQKGKTASIRRLKKSSIEKRALQLGDILLEISGGGPDQPVGRVIYIDNQAIEVNSGYEKVCTNFLRLVRLTDALDKKYVKKYLDSFYLSGEIVKYQGGSNNLRNLKYKEFETIKIPLPPLAEQKRIVAKLDTLFASLENTKTRLEKIPVLLKNFKQAILTQAVTGKLTEQWREGKELERWEEIMLEDVLPKGGIFDGPFGSKLKTEHYTSIGVQVIRLENINHLSFDNSKEIFISDERYKTLLRHTVREGDIIFASFISEEIRACILPKLKTNTIAKADCFCVRPSCNIVKPKYLLYSLVSRKSYYKLINNIHGSTRPRINTTQLKKLVISVPPLEEQTEIVRRVESLFAKVDAIEAQYKSLKQKIDTLPQALLAKAFRGELVAQNPLDEPASVLLANIQALRQAQEPVKRKTVRKKQVNNDLSMAAEPKAEYK